MKEINEKDLEKTAGGHKVVDGVVYHDAFESCEMFERRNDPSLPDVQYNHCFFCAYAEKAGHNGESFICLLGR